MHSFDELFDVKIPVPALERGWLHGRELTLCWDIERIAAQIGERCWFSHYHRDPRATDPDCFDLVPVAIAGFWPAGGFLELQLHGAYQLEEQPRGVLGIYSDSPARTEALMADLVANYRCAPAKEPGEPKIGMLHISHNRLAVEHIGVTEQQIVPRGQLDLYYPAGMSAWADAWIDLLNTRRYGLTVLTGAPGTGKTTLLRSLAHWLADTHTFYFTPASRFTSIESGEIVSFWASENRQSSRRKILILEDAESVLQRRADDNREKVATLLNLTDGMLGDALGLQVVCTLNCELAELDPALLRPGRLIAHREFELLTAEEAQRLAAMLGVVAPDGDRVALAELFNVSATETPMSPHHASRNRRRTMGFHTLMPEPGPQAGKSFQNGAQAGPILQT